MTEPIAPTEVEEIIVAPSQPKPTTRGVEVYQPRISLMLRKSINRRQEVAGGVELDERAKNLGGADLDLARFLGQGSSVSVRRTCRGPDSGMFSIEFPDQMQIGQVDSLYGLIEPMDVLEIRMARDVVGAGVKDMPLVLRGFVSSVSRNEAMGPTGPIRTVTITGHDYSKILQIMRVIYLPTMIVGQDLLSNFKLFLNYGPEAQTYETAAEFVLSIVGEVVNEFLGKMSAAGAGRPIIYPLAVDATSPADFSLVSPFGTQEWPGGTIYDLLSHFGDVGAWQELFVRDDESGPVLVYRPTPFRTAAGDYIQPGSEAETIAIDAGDVVALSANRSDMDVGNYFWVASPQYQLVGQPLLKLDQDLEPKCALTDYQNSDPIIYGIRLLEAQTQQGARYDGQSAESVAEGDALALKFNGEKRRVLIENNKDNVVFETGNMRLKGNPSIQAGMYVRLSRGDFVADYYAHTVVHEFTYGAAFMTSIEFDRGTGFIERVQRGGADSAYLAELTIGGVYD